MARLLRRKQVQQVRLTVLTKFKSLADTCCVFLTHKDKMDLDEGAVTKASQRISTHGPRGSRNEEWRKSKGMASRPKSRGMNRQGGIAATRKAGRSSRRR